MFNLSRRNLDRTRAALNPPVLIAMLCAAILMTLMVNGQVHAHEPDAIGAMFIVVAP